MKSPLSHHSPQPPAQQSVHEWEAPKKHRNEVLADVIGWQPVVALQFSEQLDRPFSVHSLASVKLKGRWRERVGAKKKVLIVTSY